MALFPNNENGGPAAEVETVIGPSVKVDGNFHGDGNVRVEGVVHGTLKTNHDLSVGANAKIKAEVEAKNIHLSGEIRGNIKVTERAQLTSSAKLFGDIEAKLLAVDEGAIINGKVHMTTDNDASVTEPNDTKAEKKKEQPTK